MIRNIIVISVLLLFIVAATGCISPASEPANSTGNWKPEAGNSSWPPADLATSNDIIDFILYSDKNITGSYEDISFTVAFNSTRTIKNATLYVHGFLSTYGAEYLKQDRNIEVVGGSNTIVFYYTMPECSRCSGLPPGTYVIYAELMHYNETIANNSIIVMIK